MNPVAGAGYPTQEELAQTLQPFLEKQAAEKAELEARIEQLHWERNCCISLIAQMAECLKLTIGLGADPKEPEWPVVFLELPSGQVSWHVPMSEIDNFSFLGAYFYGWDGHTTEEKYDRVLNSDLIPELYYAPCS
ncbi:hypothetical protein H6G00_01525 [Leptolyngbya sp. FACHB-541]|uniref:WDGH domain-containing protein n=1 Tax=Leptolyngbya sp. FACHB-541 TaxID=2692810 RepID=UPI0016822637|nr:hypothetical protein [Leptolyngbya sp. FACHB-541]MBD1995310.1 hypothetical protein [Leptolyngbya sp. FACHB-541]